MSEQPKNHAFIVLPYTTRIDQAGVLRLSSHSSFIATATFDRYKEGGIDSVFIPGENAFDLQYSSTAVFMRERLIVLGIPECKIFIAGNLLELLFPACR